MPVFYLLHGEEYNSNGLHYKSYDLEEHKGQLRVICNRCNGKKDKCTAFRLPFEYVRQGDKDGPIRASHRKGVHGRVNNISGLHYE